MNSRGCRRTEHALPRPADGSGESGPSRGSAVAKVRVYELAKEFGVESKAVMAKLGEMGEFVRSASSTIEPPVVRKLKEAFAGQATAAKTSAGQADGARHASNGRASAPPPPTIAPQAPAEPARAAEAVAAAELPQVAQAPASPAPPPVEPERGDDGGRPVS